LVRCALVAAAVLVAALDHLIAGRPRPPLGAGMDVLGAQPRAVGAVGLGVILLGHAIPPFFFRRAKGPPRGGPAMLGRRGAGRVAGRAATWFVRSAPAFRPGSASTATRPETSRGLDRRSGPSDPERTRTGPAGARRADT